MTILINAIINHFRGTGVNGVVTVVAIGTWFAGSPFARIIAIEVTTDNGQGRVLIPIPVVVIVDDDDNVENISVMFIK